MNFSFGQTWASLQAMINDALQRLPQIVPALLVFAIFYAVGRIAKLLIRRFTQGRQHTRNLGLVTARLTYAGVLLLACCYR